MTTRPNPTRRRQVFRLFGVATAFLWTLSAWQGSAAAKPQKARPKPPPLEGTSYDYEHNGRELGHPERAWLGRAFVHRRAATTPDKPLPLLVFIHGLNSERIKYRWMGGGNEGDVRRILSGLIETEAVPPMLVAAPSSIVPEAIFNAMTSWPAFDLDHFLSRTSAALKGIATIDPDRIILAAHSGGGCNPNGGIATAVHASAPVLAALVIDTCMTPEVASRLAKARPSTHVVISWQTMSWAKRPISLFQSRFLSDVQSAPPLSGILRELEYVRPKEPMPHDAMVPLSLRRWLPELLSGSKAPSHP
jgi:poly(3-hydroxybutyrate) depolymerase